MPPQVVVLIIVVVSMAVWFVLERLARWAGVRRIKTYDYAAAFLLGTIGAYLGWLDGDRNGAIVGGFIGFLGGAMVASVIFGALATVWSFFLGPPRKKKDKDQPQTTSFLRRLAILGAGSLTVVYAAVLAHEVYWMANLGALAAQYNIGFLIVDDNDREEPLGKLQSALKAKRWTAEVTQWQPTEIIVDPDFADAGPAAVAYIDLICGSKPPANMPAGWKQNPDGKTLWAVWNKDDYDPKMLTRELQTSIGLRICFRRFEMFNECLDRTLVLQYLPRSVFVRGEKAVKQRVEQNRDKRQQMQHGM